jgi:putative thioredoxin
MNESQYITNVTGETFQEEVIERSRRVPVLVDYWADWCGPCKMQGPVLTELLGEFAGGFLLAKVNTDEERALAQEHGIRSLPTMRLYKDGAMIEEILGAQTLATMRSLLERYVARPSDKAVENAIEAFRQGRTEQALETLAAAREADPGNHRIPLAYAELCLKTGRFDTAQATLDELPAELRETPEAARLQALITFASIAQTAPAREDLERRVREQPADTEARYQLAAHLVISGELPAAMDQLLAIIQHDREFRDDAGYKGLLGVFELAEDDAELVSEYRRKLFNSLH